MRIEHQTPRSNGLRFGIEWRKAGSNQIRVHKFLATRKLRQVPTGERRLSGTIGAGDDEDSWI